MASLGIWAKFPPLSSPASLEWPAQLPARLVVLLLAHGLPF